MKIGFLGNTNNFPFMLARAFRRAGHDVVSIVNRKENLHRPEFRYSDITYPYPEWIREIIFPDEAAFVTRSPARREALKILRACDFVVLNDLGTGMAADIGRPYLSLLTGADLSFYCDPASGSRVLGAMTTRNPLKRIWGRVVWKRLLDAQRDGVRRASLVFHFARGLIPTGDALLDDLGVDDTRRIFFLMADIAAIACSDPPNNSRLRTFCATRLTWQKPMLPGDSHLDFKGSDVMVRGLGLFHRKTSAPLDVNLVRKGRHVEETVKLVADEDLASVTTWHDEMSQADIWRQYAQAELVFEQFGDGIVAMAGLEAMASGRPVIANGRPDILEPLLGEPSPICQATEPEQVCQHLEQLTQDPEYKRALGLRSREWVERHFTPDAAARRILEHLADELPGRT